MGDRNQLWNCLLCSKTSGNVLQFLVAFKCVSVCAWVSMYLCIDTHMQIQLHTHTLMKNMDDDYFNSHFHNSVTQSMECHILYNKHKFLIRVLKRFIPWIWSCWFHSLLFCVCCFCDFIQANIFRKDIDDFINSFEPISKLYSIYKVHFLPYTHTHTHVHHVIFFLKCKYIFI